MRRDSAGHAEAGFCHRSSDGEAEIMLPGNVVNYCADGSTKPTPIDGATEADVVALKVQFERTGNKFAVFHLAGQRKV
jgi:hypothetical protein